MNIFNALKSEIKKSIEVIAAREGWPSELPVDRITAEPPRDPSHGDIATNAAMVLAKPAGVKPRGIAEPLAAALLDLDMVVSAEVAGPGFINLRLSPDLWRRQVGEILRVGTAYGDS